MIETPKVLTIDDEILALRRLRLILRDLQDVEHVGEASSCDEALEKIRQCRPDILLLDIKMRDGSGFDLLDQLHPGEVAAVIFVSAFSHYATRAFDSAAADYILKPVESARLAQAIERARSRIRADDAEQQLAELRAIVASLRSDLEEKGSSPYEKEFWIRESVTGFVRVPVDAIEWVSSEDDYVRLHTRDGSHLMRSSIKKFESRVDPAIFVRIHRCTLVRTSAIRQVRNPPFGPQEVVLTNNQRLRVGRVYAKRFKEALLQQRLPAEMMPADSPAAESSRIA